MQQLSNPAAGVNPVTSATPQPSFVAVAVNSAAVADSAAAINNAAQAAQIAEQLVSRQIGLQSDGGFVPVPVSLTPWQLSHTQFEQARRLALLLGHIQAQAATQLPWLLQLTRGLQSSATVPGQIWRTLQQLPAYSATTASDTTAAGNNLMLNRHDFILDQQQQWRWVESNPIAAGMGPLNARYLQLLRHYHPSFAAHSSLAAADAGNPATDLQAQLLADAAFARAAGFATTSQRQPLLLMVVEAWEDNVYDQLLLANAVQQLGVQVKRVTIDQLLQSEFDRDNRLHWQQQPVALIYWRTGYNPGTELNEAFWLFRARLEQSQLTQCPTLAGQLTGSKWFQHQFTALLLSEPQAVAQRFTLSPADIALLQQVVLPSFAVTAIPPALAHQLIDQGYWYKTQQEGGGNVARAAAALIKLADADAADLLMAPIAAKVRYEPLYSLRGGELSMTGGHISELGIFSLGDTASYGGYLCRTKPAQNNEGGVHRGGAVLDTILLR